MEKAIIETAAGYSGVCWSGAGLVALRLPVPTIYEAEMELGSELANLSRQKNGGRGAGGGKIEFGLVEKEIREYFSGKRVSLSFPVDWSVYSDFQKKVLQQVYKVPWGQVVSYGQVAAAAGSPRGARAAGGAVGSNRVLLVVPCHRVIAHDGTIGGFGGGLDWKRKLLKIEGISL